MQPLFSFYIKEDSKFDFECGKWYYVIDRGRLVSIEGILDINY